MGFRIGVIICILYFIMMSGVFVLYRKTKSRLLGGIGAVSALPIILEIVNLVMSFINQLIMGKTAAENIEFQVQYNWTQLSMLMVACIIGMGCIVLFLWIRKKL